METGSSRESTARVVVLCDSRWPDLPGVCCWRAAVDEAFAVAGAAVTEATWQGPRPAVKTDGAVAPVKTPKLPWLPSPVRRPMVASYRLARQAASRLRSTPKPSVTPIPGTEGAQIVLAESMPAARAAIRRGAPADRVWALSLPPARTIQGAGSAYTALVEELARRSPDSSPTARSGVTRSSVRPPPAGPGSWSCRPSPSTASAPPAERPRHRSSPSSTTEPRQGDRSGGFPALRLAPGDRAWPCRRRLAGALLVPDGPAAAAFPPAWSPALWLDWTQERPPRPGRASPTPRRTGRPRLRTAAPERCSMPRCRRVPATPRPARRDDLGLRPQVHPRARRPARQPQRPRSSRSTSGRLISQRSASETAALLRGGGHDRRRVGPAERRLAGRAEAARPVPRRTAAPLRARLGISPQDRHRQGRRGRLHRSAIGPRIRDEIGWPKEKLVYIPNFLDIDWFDRPKLPGRPVRDRHGRHRLAASSASTSRWTWSPRSAARTLGSPCTCGRRRRGTTSTCGPAGGAGIHRLVPGADRARPAAARRGQARSARAGTWPVGTAGSATSSR